MLEWVKVISLFTPLCFILTKKRVFQFIINLTFYSIDFRKLVTSINDLAAKKIGKKESKYRSLGDVCIGCIDRWQMFSRERESERERERGRD